MKRFFYILSSLCCLTCIQAVESEPSHADLQKKLDYTVKYRSRHHAEKEKRIDDLKNHLRQGASDKERFELYSRLYEMYIAYQTDSALNYVHKKEALLTYLTDDTYRYDTQLNHSHSASGASRKHETRILPSLPNPLRTHGRLCIDERREERLSAKQYDATIDLLKTATDTCDNKEKTRFLAYTLSEAYAQKGKREERKHYLMLSAVADLESPVKEYISLRKLAFLLYEDGDIDRAYEYMKCSLEDALSCNARSRTIEVTEIFPVIDKAYRLKSERKQRTITILLISISFLALCLIVAVIYVYRQMKKLAAARQALANANRQLKAFNDTLKETNLIKEEYIAQYINRCSVYIDKLDKYRRRLTKLASTSKLEELFKAIKSDAFIEAERKEFYTEFDHTFLNLFPHFVTAFNQLLNDTELRIFALIRLGITDSTRIAEFLQYSVTTIYNYRSKTRNKAKGDKNEFEAAVMKIG